MTEDPQTNALVYPRLSTSNLWFSPQYRFQWIIGGFILAFSAALLFVNLGHYALWDDEAMIGLIAQGVAKTGDTSVKIGHNIVGYEQGLLLRNFHDRSTPPLPAYLTAASFLIFSPTTLAARAPFAFIGLVAIGWMVFWAINEGATIRTLVVLGIAIVGNVSLFLFCRQCRYYAPAILSSVAIAWCYLHRDGSRWPLWCMAGFSIVLLASSTMQFVALYCCLGADYGLWGRRTQKIGWNELLTVMLPIVLIGGCIVWIWNPFSTGSRSNILRSGLLERIKFMFWLLRDINVCEFGVILLLLGAPILYFWRENQWLLRIPLALACYVVVIGLLYPVRSQTVSEVRYLSPTIPLWIALGVIVVNEVAPRNWAAWLVAICMFWTNFIDANWLIPIAYQSIHLRSTIISYVGELVHPPSDPFTTASAWINEHVRERESLWVIPGYATYPLMFSAPRALYGWQFNYPPTHELAGLPDIHFIGRAAPDFIVAFGHGVLVARQAVTQMNAVGVRYRELPPLAGFGRDAFRPELFAHSFSPITDFNPQTEGIYVFERQLFGN